MTKYTKEQVIEAFTKWQKEHPTTRIEFKGDDSVWFYWKPDSKPNKKTFKGLIDYISFKPKDDIFKLNELTKQVKKQWKSVSCSMTTEEYEKLQKIASNKKVKLNQLIRTILLRVIESNK